MSSAARLCSRIDTAAPSWEHRCVRIKTVMTGKEQFRSIGPGVGILVPVRGSFTEVESEYPGIKEIKITVDLINGVASCIAMSVVMHPGHALTGTLIRQLPIRGLTEKLAVKAIGVRDTSGGPVDFPFVVPKNEILDIRQSGPTDKNLQLAATLYSIGKAMAQAPAQQVVTTLGLTRSTATRWIAKARAKGFLSD